MSRPKVGRSGPQTRQGTLRRREEKDVDAAVVELLRGLGWRVSRFQQARESKITRGVPDLYAMHPRLKLAVWIELKAPDGRRSPAQAAWHQAAAECGVPVLVTTSAADLAEQLQRIRAECPRCLLSLEEPS